MCWPSRICCEASNRKRVVLLSGTFRDPAIHQDELRASERAEWKQRKPGEMCVEGPKYLIDDVGRPAISLCSSLLALLL